MAVGRIIAVGLLLGLLGAVSAPAQEGALAEMRRRVRLEVKKDVFKRQVRNVIGQAKVKSFTVHLDWWNGGPDDRVGDPGKAEREFVFEVQLGRGEWRELPPVTRDLRLTARAASPEGLFAGEPVVCEWSVRMKKGDEPVRVVSLEIVYLAAWGKAQMRPDLRIDAIVFSDLESHPPPPGSLPLRRDFVELSPGRTYTTRLHLANAGYADVDELDLSFFLTPLEGKGRTKLPSAKVEILLREGESMRKKWSCPVPEKLEPGLYRLHAVADLRDRITEIDEENNELTRIVEVKAPRK